MLSAAVGAGALLKRSGALPEELDNLPGLGSEQEAAYCADPASLVTRSTIGNAELVYEIDQKPQPMKFDAGFHDQLTSWLKDWNATNPYGPVSEIWGYGAYVPKDGCRSWHAAGRGFDISRLRSGGDLLVSAREDLWDEVSAERRAELKRRYWRLGASLNLHFAYVLSYRFDKLHRNHFHIDNGVSESGMSRFNSRSRVQNQSVQEICANLWGQPGEVTGEWSDAKKQVAPVLDQLGLGSLARQQNWQGFLRASVRR